MNFDVKDPVSTKRKEIALPVAVMTDAELKEWLYPVEDPELFMSLVSLGLVYEIKHNDQGESVVKMTLTSPGCPAGDYLVNEVRKRMLENDRIATVDVDIVWDPKWDPKEMASEEAKEQLGIW